MHYSPEDLGTYSESPLASILHPQDVLAATAWEELHNKTPMIGNSLEGLETNHCLQMYPLDLREAKEQTRAADPVQHPATALSSHQTKGTLQNGL